MEVEQLIQEQKNKLLKTRPINQKVYPEFFLRQAILTFNSQCNAKCKACYGRTYNKPYMPLEKAEEVIKVISKDLNIKDIYVSSLAELTLYPPLLDFMKYIENLNTHNVYFTQYTNGRYIPEGFIEQINSMNTYWSMIISCWGYDEESWTKYQGPGNFNLFVENCKKYLKELKYPPSISIVAITEEQRDKTFKFVKNLCDECGLKYTEVYDGSSSYLRQFKEAKIVPIHINKYLAPDNEIDANDENRDLVQFYVHKIDDVNNKEDFINYNNCNLLAGVLSIDSLGYIYPCVAMNGKGEKYAVGNVNNYKPFTKEDLYNIYHSDRFMQMWKNNFEPGKIACPMCKDCASRTSC